MVAGAHEAAEALLLLRARELLKDYAPDYRPSMTDDEVRDFLLRLRDAVLKGMGGIIKALDERHPSWRDYVGQERV